LVLCGLEPMPKAKAVADEVGNGHPRRGTYFALDFIPLKVKLNKPHRFVAALALADTLEAYLPKELISVKWPNDVLLAGKKTAGILLESGKTHHQKWMVIGIGVNLTQHPEGTEYPATHVLEHILPSDLETPEPIMTGAQAVLAILASRFDHWRHILTMRGFEPIGAAWAERAHNVPCEGDALGLDANGALRVRLAGGTIRDVHAGDVFFGSDKAN